jgi:hypothetical protein
MCVCVKRGATLVKWVGVYMGNVCMCVCVTRSSMMSLYVSS